MSKKLAGLALAKIRFDQCVKFIVPLMGPSDGRLDLLSARGIPYAPIEVAEILAHLVEREPEGEQALRGVQQADQASGPRRESQRSSAPSSAKWLRQPRAARARAERPARPHFGAGDRLRSLQCARAAVRARLNSVRKRLGGGSSEHDEVVTEPKQRPEQRSQVGVGGEEAYPFVPGLDGDRLRHCSTASPGPTSGSARSTPNREAAETP